MALYTTSTAFPFSTAIDIEPFQVPTDSPILEFPELRAPLAQSQHALYTTTYFPSYPSCSGFVLCRVIGDGYTLELRWMSFVKGERRSEDSYNPYSALDNQGTLEPVYFTFPSPILPNPTISATTETLTLTALTRAGYLYTLEFLTSNLFYSPTLAEEDWSHEYKVAKLDGKRPILMESGEPGKVVIGCSDGVVFNVEVDNEGNHHEIELRTSSSTFSLGRTKLPSPAVSFASSSVEGLTPFAFGVSRDRKLRVWNLDSGVCSVMIDLPRAQLSDNDMIMMSGMDSPAVSKVNGKKALDLLPEIPSTYLKVVQGDDISTYDSYLVLYSMASIGSPAAFFIYGIVTDDVGAIKELVLEEERVCSTGGEVLVDFEVAQFDATGTRTWTLWSVWEESGEPEIRFITLSGLGAAGSNSASTEDWIRVGRGSVSVASWTSGHFDELLQDNPAAVVDIFTSHVFYPGRYSPLTLEFALEQYETSSFAELDPRDRPEVYSIEHETIDERIMAIVGCMVQLEMSIQTGAYLHDIYYKKLKVEWLKFVAMCNESKMAALFPTTITCCPSRGLVTVITRDAIITPVIQDTVLAMRRLEGNDLELSAFMKLSEEQIKSAYPDLSPVDTRQDIFSILSAITQLTSQLPLSVSRQIEAELLHIVRNPIKTEMTVIALGIYDKDVSDHISDIFQITISQQLGRLSNPELSFQSLWNLLTTAELIGLIDPQEVNSISDLSNASLADLISTSIEARYQLTLQLIILLAYVHGEEEGLIPISTLYTLTKATFATFHSLSALRWLIQQGPPDIDATAGDDSILELFGGMKVTTETGSASTSFSLLNSLLRDRHSPSISTTLPLPTSMTTAASMFLASTGLISQKETVIDTPQEVAFGFRLTELRLFELAEGFTLMYPKSAGMLYVNGLALVGLERFEEAQLSFAKAASALYDQTLRIDETVGLAQILPVEVAGSLARYYRHVVSIFADSQVDPAIVQFTELAIEAYSTTEEGDLATKELWMKLFKSYSALGLYEDAYMTLMAMPQEDQKSGCLAHLISILCENGQVALMNSYAFVGLQGELQRNLAFRARNSDPLATPNYYKILYSYHISKGDHRSAGSIMLQQARRIGEIAGRAGEFNSLATLQCQAYLACMNSLSLVEKKNAWVAVVADEESLNRSNKRRKMSYHIPEEEYDTNTKPVEILELSDIRSEYTIVLSRLMLIPDFPELARSNLGLEPESIVSLFSQTGAFDAAISAAVTLGVDMSSLFEVITGKCVTLALNELSDSDSTNWIQVSPLTATWTGTLAEKAWKLLEIHLNRHDDLTYQYRRVALRKCLDLNRVVKQIPNWLIQFFLEKDSRVLIRVMLEFGRLEEAFEYSLITIKASNPDPTSISITAMPTSLPYSLFDSLLALKSQESPEIDAVKLTSLQKELRSALADRIAIVEKIQKRL